MKLSAVETAAIEVVIDTVVGKDAVELAALETAAVDVVIDAAS